MVQFSGWSSRLCASWLGTAGAVGVSFASGKSFSDAEEEEEKEALKSDFDRFLISESPFARTEPLRPPTAPVSLSLSGPEWRGLNTVVGFAWLGLNTAVGAF